MDLSNDWLKKDSGTPSVYYGYATTTAASSDALWAIRKVTTDSTVETVTWNDNSTLLYNAIWDDRVATFISPTSSISITWSVASTANSFGITNSLINISWGKPIYNTIEATYASYAGTPSGCAKQIELLALTSGTIGNTIKIVGDGTTDLDTLISNWNSSNKDNQLKRANGLGTEVISNKTTVYLSGGEDGSQGEFIGISYIPGINKYDILISDQNGIIYNSIGMEYVNTYTTTKLTDSKSGTTYGFKGVPSMTYSVTITAVNAAGSTSSNVNILT